MVLVLEREEVKIDSDFKAVPGYEGHYEINRLGEIRSFKETTSKINKELQVVKYKLNPFMRNDGKYYVNLYINSHRMREPVHRLVAATFMEDYRKGTTIYFIDDNPSNYSLDNLSLDSALKREKYLRFAVKLVDIETGQIYKFPNGYRAAEAIGCSHTNFYMKKKMQFKLRNYLVTLIPK